MKKLFFVAMTAMLCCCTAVLDAADALKRPKYIFLFIGDGMSIPQRHIAEFFNETVGGDKLLINHLATNAVTATRSGSSFITDSAASGTAIACGEKTKNGRIGMDYNGQKPLESCAKVAKRIGYRVGIVTSVTLNHATPAAFYACNANRGAYYQIGLDLINSGFDYFGGGQISKANDTKDKKYQGDIYELARKAGFKVARTTAAFNALKAGDRPVLAIREMTEKDGALPYAIDRTDSKHPDLAGFVAKGIELLDNDTGFFMMVEGGKIDWMGHANDAATEIREVIDLDRAVRVAYDFAQKHAGETLIVVTGDHETGGLTLGFANTGYTMYPKRLAKQNISQFSAAAYLKTLSKSNPGNFTFEAIKPFIRRRFGLLFPGDKADSEDDKGILLTTQEVKDLEKCFKESAAKKPAVFASRLCTVLANKSGLGWTSKAHTALRVSTTGWGFGS